MALGTNPIRRIVTLLQNMQTQDGKHDADFFDKYMCWCQTGTGDLEKSTKDADTKIPILECSVRSEPRRGDRSSRKESSCLRHGVCRSPSEYPCDSEGNSCNGDGHGWTPSDFYCIQAAQADDRYGSQQC